VADIIFCNYCGHPTCGNPFYPVCVEFWGEGDDPQTVCSHCMFGVPNPTPIWNRAEEPLRGERQHPPTKACAASWTRRECEEIGPHCQWNYPLVPWCEENPWWDYSPILAQPKRQTGGCKDPQLDLKISQEQRTQQNPGLKHALNTKDPEQDHSEEIPSLRDQKIKVEHQGYNTCYHPGPGPARVMTRMPRMTRMPSVTNDSICLVRRWSQNQTQTTPTTRFVQTGPLAGALNALTGYAKIVIANANPHNLQTQKTNLAAESLEDMLNRVLLTSPLPTPVAFDFSVPCVFGEPGQFQQRAAATATYVPLRSDGGEKSRPVQW
jgi:hypothetical protein